MKKYRKIKPAEFLWCVTLQVSLMFREEAWLEVTTEHTTTGSVGSVFYGKIWIDTRELPGDLEFSVHESQVTDEVSDRPLASDGPGIPDPMMIKAFLGGPWK